MYAQDDLTSEIEELESNYAFNFVSKSEQFTFIEWILYSSYLTEYKYSLLSESLSEDIKEFRTRSSTGQST